MLLSKRSRPGPQATPINKHFRIDVSRLLAHSVANDGWGPTGAPTQLSDSSLVGAAAFGSQYNGGVLYQISASGVYSILHQFGSVANGGNLPFCVLYNAPDGNIYGTTWIGGASGGGVIFKLVP